GSRVARHMLPRVAHGHMLASRAQKHVPPVHDTPLPSNVRLGPNSVITGDYLTRDRSFRLFRSRLDPGLVVGASCTMDGVMFNAGPEARIEIGDHCYFHEATLVGDLEIRIGCRVVIGWHATVIDADFHPSDAAARMAD